MAQVIRAKARWNVSATALANRLHALGLIADWTYRAALVELSKRGVRSARPGSALVHESSQVLGKVLAGLHGQGMTVRDIAKEFGLTPQGVTEYLFGLTTTQHEGNGSGRSRMDRFARASLSCEITYLLGAAPRTLRCRVCARQNFSDFSAYAPVECGCTRSVALCARLNERAHSVDLGG
ncbi:hypothetical protein [Nocardia fluminea]|uniref:hypothetical protein n=1 Tax=Nocardia fluminea TaxID=134984 RepID=UPI0033CC87A1